MCVGAHFAFASATASASLPSLALLTSTRAQCQKFCSKSKIGERAARRSVSDASKMTNSCCCCLHVQGSLSPALALTHTCALLLQICFEPVALLRERAGKVEKEKQLANSDTKNWNKRSKRKSTPKTGIVQINLDINCVPGRVCVCMCVCICLFPAPFRFFVPSSTAYSSLACLLWLRQKQEKQNKEAQISSKSNIIIYFHPLTKLLSPLTLSHSLSPPPTLAWESRVVAIVTHKVHSN